MFDYHSIKEEKLRDIFKNVPFSMDPMYHQMLTFSHALGENAKRVLMLHDIGTGKTLSATWLMYHFWRPKKILVVCPRSAFRGWRRDLGPNTDWNYIILEGLQEERKEILAEAKHDVYIINYEGLKSIYGEREQPRGKSKKRPWFVASSKMVDGFDAIVLDEVHKCGNSGTSNPTLNSLQTEICYQLSWRAKYCIGLTGTINPDLSQLWAVTKVVDLGDTFGVNYWNFRRRYMHNVRWKDWEPNEGAEELVMRELLPMTTSFSREECLPNLPGRMDSVREADASKEQEKLFKKCLEGLNVELREGVLNASNVLVRTQKLRQIASGFLYLDDKGERGIKRLKQNPKLQLLEDIFDETRLKVIIWHQFTEEAHIIEEWADKEGIHYASLRAEIKDKDVEEEKFMTDPDCQLLIAHPACAKESLDFTCCHLMVFFSNSGSIIERLQCEGRIRRKFQNYRQFFIDLVIKDSVDEIRVGSITNQKEVAEKMLNFIRTFGRIL